MIWEISYATPMILGNWQDCECEHVELDFIPVNDGDFSRACCFHLFYLIVFNQNLNY